MSTPPSNNFETFWLQAINSSSSLPQLPAGREEITNLPAQISNVTSAAIFSDGLISGSLSMKDASAVKEFSDEVAEYSTNDEVISELSRKIKTPKDGETEDEFVERASQVLKGILKKRFGV